LSILKPINRIDSGMFRSLRGVGLTTHTFGTTFHGVCERDGLSLSYAPAIAADTREKPEDQSIKPYGLKAFSAFLFLSPPEPNGFVQEDRPMVWSAECQSADKIEEGWFVAEDAFSAVQGALMFRLMLDGIKTDSLRPLPCPELLDKAQTCAQAILTIGDLSKIDSIAACSAPEGSLCYVVDLNGSTRLTITGQGDNRSVRPSAILSVTIEQYIVVT
jgi:hypothetical protein